MAEVHEIHEKKPRLAAAASIGICCVFGLLVILIARETRTVATDQLGRLRGKHVVPAETEIGTQAA